MGIMGGRAWNWRRVGRRRDDECSAFLIHIPKTAGTSLLALVDHEYGVGDYGAIYPGWPEMRAEVVEFAGSKGGLRAVIGHFAYGLHRDPSLVALMPPKPAYVVILREPARRVVSLYNYISNSTHPVHQAITAEHPTLESFLDHPWSRDTQSALLLGDVLGRENLAEALIARMKSGFVAVGLAERFDESVALIGSALGWRLDRYVGPRNVGRPSPGQARFEDLNPKLIARIQDVNRLDQLAYDIARSEFDARCAAVPGFQRRLARYRQSPRLVG